MATLFALVVFSFVQYCTTTAAQSAASACRGRRAEFSLTFRALWSQATHPNAYIAGAHFSPIIGASHNASYTMWRPGQMATNGVKSVAETGKTAILTNEIVAQISIGFAHSLVRGAGVNSPGMLTGIKLSVDDQYPLVSIITMIAPSPDWFVGVRDVDLCDAKSGRFKDRISFDLFPYDSGTDSGKMFDSPNMVTNPAEPIFRITRNMDTVFKSNSPIAKMAIMEFVKVKEVVTRSPCFGQSAKYTLSFSALWSQATHPTAYIAGAHFSPIIGASHNASYTMWRPGQMATPGVKTVAETGNPMTLSSEIAAQIRMGFAHKVISRNGVISSPGMVTNIQVSVNHQYPLVSIITMIAPSPDWFVGVRDVDLCDAKSGKFKERISFDLFPYDSGTDSGKMFDSPNMVTNPTEPIFRITRNMDTVFKSNSPIAKMATMEFMKLEPCFGMSARYKLDFEAIWSKQTHPTAFIAAPYFSPLIGASHNERYKIWGPGRLATNGVRMVAEKGILSMLYNEIRIQMEIGNAFKAMTGHWVRSPGNLTGVEVSVSYRYPLVSFISMIAPSPDWFVGIHDVNLCDANTAKFKNQVSFDLGPWDAGTDNGKKFYSFKVKTDPPKSIFKITNSLDTSFKSSTPIHKMAVIRLTKINEDRQ